MTGEPLLTISKPVRGSRNKYPAIVFFLRREKSKMSGANEVAESIAAQATRDATQGQPSTTSRGEKAGKGDGSVMNSQIAVELCAPSSQEQLIVNVLEGRADGQIDDATADFAAEFRFEDYGIGLKFNDRNGLNEFFQKARELYPESSFEIGGISVAGDHVIAEWTLKTTHSEPFFGGSTRKTPISLHGASFVRTLNGKITEWADYYDGLTARRTALASYFTEWVEL
jgi:hypothetical protein